MVALESDGAAAGFGEFRHAAEFAGGDALFEVFTAEDVFEVADAIDLVETFVRTDHDADVVPLANGFGGVESFAGFGVDGGLIEAVEPAAALFVGGFFVVFELDFRAGGPHGVGFVSDMENDAAVSGFGDVVFKLEFEPAKGGGVDEVAGVFGIDAGEGAILDLPAGADGGFFEVGPAFQVGSVKEELPTIGFFSLCKSVVSGGFFLCGGSGEETGSGDKSGGEDAE